MKTIDESKLKDLITQHTETAIAEGRLGCAEILVNQCGRRVFHGLLGDDPGDGKALRPGRIFRAASMTKPVTTAALLRLFEEGSVDLDAPVSRYLPAFTHMDLGHADRERRVIIDGPARNELKVYQLLCHTNGIGTDPFCAITAPVWKSTEDTARFYADQPLAFEPGTAQSYSPTAAFDVAARIIEVQSGMRFPDYVKAYITSPLGMKDTTFSPDEEQWSRIVGMHARAEDGTGIKGDTTPGCVFEEIPPAACAAGAGMITTAEDYSLFAEMLLNRGTGRDGRRILNEASVRRMSTPHVTEEIMPGDERWGLGVRVITGDGYAHGLPVGAFGWSGAYGTHFWVDPENAITAVYMKNSRYDGGAGCHTANAFEEDVMHSCL